MTIENDAFYAGLQKYNKISLVPNGLTLCPEYVDFHRKYGAEMPAWEKATHLRQLRKYFKAGSMVLINNFDGFVVDTVIAPLSENVWLSTELQTAINGDVNAGLCFPIIDNKT